MCVVFATAATGLDRSTIGFAGLAGGVAPFLVRGMWNRGVLFGGRKMSQMRKGGRKVCVQANA